MYLERKLSDYIIESRVKMHELVIRHVFFEDYCVQECIKQWGIITRCKCYLNIYCNALLISRIAGERRVHVSHDVQELVRLTAFPFVSN